MALSRTNRGTASNTWTSRSNATITSASFTPAAGALLLCLFNENVTDSAAAVTFSSTITGQGAWTLYQTTPQNDGFGDYSYSVIAVSKCGASPGAGTVTATSHTGGPFTSQQTLETIEISGQNATPVAQNGTAVGVGATLTVTFGSTPATSSYVFTTCQDNGVGLGTQPTGHTLLQQFSAGGGVMQNSEDLASAAQASQWSGLGSFINSMVAVEIAVAVDPMRRPPLLGRQAVNRAGSY